MGVPKKRTSRSRRDTRRSHDALTPPNVTKCPNCQEPMVGHRVCAKCGQYKGRQVLPAKE